jgi:hypothetical protein
MGKIIDIKFESDDHLWWQMFRAKNLNTLTNDEYTKISELHAKYFKHPMNRPCTCSPKGIQRYITDLNKIFDNG